jgi:hypothetical protein
MMTHWYYYCATALSQNPKLAFLGVIYGHTDEGLFNILTYFSAKSLQLFGQGQVCSKQLKLKITSLQITENSTTWLKLAYG